jgi:hypothetical protein
VAAQAVARRTHAIAGLRDQLDDRLGAFEQLRARAGQPNASAVADEQRDAELVFQLGDLPTERWLRDMLFPRRATDAADPRDMDERSQFSDLDDGLRSSRGVRYAISA